MILQILEISFEHNPVQFWVYYFGNSMFIQSSEMAHFFWSKKQGCDTVMMQSMSLLQNFDKDGSLAYCHNGHDDDTVSVWLFSQSIMIQSLLYHVNTASAWSFPLMMAQSLHDFSSLMMMQSLFCHANTDMMTQSIFSHDDTVSVCLFSHNDEVSALPC